MAQLRTGAATVVTEGDLAVQRWEYLYAVSEFSRKVRTFRIRYVNGEELRDWEAGPGTVRYLSQWGAEGWELTSAYSIPTVDPTQLVMILKRPK
jgi:hypothetical protein